MVDLALLADEVLRELNGFSIPGRHPPGALGAALATEWYEQRLVEMRSALVPPYWIEMRDMEPESKALVILRVAVVADDGDGSLVCFDPGGQGEYVLAVRDQDPDRNRAVGVVSCGARGDVVGCFLSR